MNAAQVLDHFDRMSDAPDAIPRLRRFILDLAVRGKLVEQDPSDEPASELLKRILAAKGRLVKEGQIIHDKLLPPIDEDEVPFKLPATWLWVRLKTITSYIQRGKSPRYATNEGLPVVSQKCVQWHGLDLASAKLITRESIDQYDDLRFLQDGDLLWNSTGTGTIGRIIRVRKPPEKLVCDSHVTVVRCLEVDAEYVRSWLRSDHVYGSIEDRAAGSTNQIELTSEMASNEIIPLAPIAEQHRIVAKMDELMTLCERLEAAQVERESRRDKLATSSLHRLNNGANADDFREHARFHIHHLPRLTTHPEHIQQLRQTILNLAVRGKLVPQDPDEEPATQLLADRQVLLASENGPRKLPIGWAWSSFELIGETLGGGTPSKTNPDFWKGSIPWVSPKDMKVDHIRDTEDHISEVAVEQSSTRLIPTGSLLMVVRGMILAHSFPTAITSVPLTINQDMKAVIPFRSELIRMLLLITKGLKNEVLRLVLRSTHGTCKLLTHDLFSLPVPIPPLAEQHRIVVKVNDLMAVCDILEAQLTTTQTDSHRLLEAVLHEALNSKIGLQG